jgi:aquaporin Z
VNGPAPPDGGRLALLHALGAPNSVLHAFDFWDRRFEGRRLFAETWGTFLLVLAGAGGPMVNARFGGAVIPYGALAVAPGLMVAAVILFMGAVSGAHLNPAVSVAFALRRDFPWRRVPAYVAAQSLGAVLAVLLLRGLLGASGTAGLTLPGPGISTPTALVWELVLTAGLVSTVLGVSSGAQQVGPIAALGVGSYIGAALVLRDWTAWWIYLVGPVTGAVVAAGIAYVLRGPGGGRTGRYAAQGTLGITWQPGPIEPGPPAGPPGPPPPR